MYFLVIDPTHLDRKGIQTIMQLIRKSLILTSIFVAVPVLGQVQFSLMASSLHDGGLDKGDFAENIVADAAGNSYVVGWINSNWGAGTDDIALYKFSKNGKLAWRQTFDGPLQGQDIGYELALDNFGHVIVVGRVMTPNTQSDYVTLKYRASDGVLIWSRLYDGISNSIDGASDVAVDAQGNIFVTGMVWNDTEYWPNGDYCTIAYDPSGKLLWEKLYDGPASYLGFHDAPINIMVDQSGDVVVSGNSPNEHNNDDIVTIKYDGATGNQLWLQRFAYGTSDYAQGLMIASNGDVIVTGNTENLGHKVAIIRYDGLTGAELWATIDRFDHHGQFSSPYSMALDAQNNVITTLQYDPDFDDSNLNDNIQTSKYDFVTGARIWSVSYGTSTKYDGQNARTVAVDSLGNVLVSGSDLFVPHTNVSFWYYRGVDGQLLWKDDHAFKDHSDDPARGIFDRFGNILAAGTNNNYNSGFSDIFFLKYRRLVPLAGPREIGL